MQYGKGGKKREYLNNYEADGSGKYIYTGVWYVLRGSTADYRRVRLFYVLLAVVEFACLIGMGCLPIGSSRTAYVMLPYVLEFLPAMLTSFAAASIAASGGRLTEHRYRKSVERLRSATVLGILFGAAAAIGQMLYLMRSREAGTRAADLLFLLGCLVSVFFNYLAIRVGSRYPWEAEEKPVK